MKLKICIFHHWASHKLLGRSEVIVTKAVSVSTIAACTDAATSASFDLQQKSPSTKGNCKLALKWTILAANGRFSFERYSCQFSRCECTIFITSGGMHTQNILRALFYSNLPDRRWRNLMKNMLGNPVTRWIWLICLISHICRPANCTIMGKFPYACQSC